MNKTSPQMEKKKSRIIQMGEKKSRIIQMGKKIKNHTNGEKKIKNHTNGEKNNQESYKWGKKNQESYKWGNRLINAHQHGFLHPEAVLSQFKCDFDNRLTSYDDLNHSITPSRLLKQVNFCFCRQIKLRQFAIIFS